MLKNNGSLAKNKIGRAFYVAVLIVLAAILDSGIQRILVARKPAVFGYKTIAFYV
ncbi:hypothetical protein D3C72_2529960 [compost metagenome]